MSIYLLRKQILCSLHSGFKAGDLEQMWATLSNFAGKLSEMWVTPAQFGWIHMHALILVFAN